MLEKGNSINFSSNKVNVNCNQKKKIVAIVSIYKLVKNYKDQHKLHTK